MQSPARPLTLLSIACMGAVVATLGDLLMLYVGNSLRPELGISTPQPWVLWLGGALGIVGIPLYALGYRAISRVIADDSPRASRIINYCGIGTAGLGVIIHGLTAGLIQSELGTGATGRSPAETIASGGVGLALLWAIAAILVLVASAAILRASLDRRSALPVLCGWVNPTFVTLALVSVGLLGEPAQSFLVPAAPNVAHVAFFGLSLVALGSARGASGRAERAS